MKIGLLSNKKATGATNTSGYKLLNSVIDSNMKSPLKNDVLAVRRQQKKCKISANSKKDKLHGTPRLIRSSIVFLKHNKDCGSRYIVNPLIPILNNLLTQTNTYHNPTRKVKLADWNRLNDASKAVFNQLAMAEVERNSAYILTPFTFHIAENLMSTLQARKASEVATIRDILKKNLFNKLGRTPEFWFSFEMGKLDTLKRLERQATGHPHIHGAILLSPDEMESARTAFHAANDLNWVEDFDDPLDAIIAKANRTTFKQNALTFDLNAKYKIAEELGELYAVMNWGSYSTKENIAVEREFIHSRPTSFSRQTNEAAKKIYDELRLSFRVDPAIKKKGAS